MDETARKMKEALKAHGISRRQATVKHRSCLYDDSYRVTVHDPLLAILEVEEIVNEFESIRYDEYCGEILSGGNNYVNVDRNEKCQPDISIIQPFVREALTAVLQGKGNQIIALPTRRYLIGQQQSGSPDLWGKKPEYMNRLTGKPREPEQEFDYMTEFMQPQLDDEKSMENVSRLIALHIAENELNLAYIQRTAKEA